MTPLPADPNWRPKSRSSSHRINETLRSVKSQLRAANIRITELEDELAQCKKEMKC